MRNFINKNIDTSIEWQWRGRKPRRKSIEEKGYSLHRGQKIEGLNIYNKKYKIPKKFSDYCGSIELLRDGILQVWTNGKYQFIKKEIAVKLLKELLKRIEEEP